MQELYYGETPVTEMKEGAGGCGMWADHDASLTRRIVGVESILECCAVLASFCKAVGES